MYNLRTRDRNHRVIPIIRIRDDDEEKTSEEEDQQQRLICCVCLKNERTHAALPCGHMSSCFTCAKRIRKGQPCPICRTPVTAWHRIYL